MATSCDGNPRFSPMEPRSGTQPCLHHNGFRTCRILQCGPGSQLRERRHRARRDTGHAHGLRHKRRWRVAVGAWCRPSSGSSTLPGSTLSSPDFCEFEQKAFPSPPQRIWGQEAVGRRGQRNWKGHVGTGVRIPPAAHLAPHPIVQTPRFSLLSPPPGPDLSSHSHLQPKRLL